MKQCTWIINYFKKGALHQKDNKRALCGNLPTDFATVYRRGGCGEAPETLTSDTAVSTIGWGEAAIRAFLPVRSNNLLG